MTRPAPPKSVFLKAQLERLEDLLGHDDYKAALRGLEALVKARGVVTRLLVRETRKVRAVMRVQKVRHRKAELHAMRIELDALPLLHRLQVLNRYMRKTDDLPHTLAEAMSGDRRCSNTRARLYRLERDMEWLLAAADDWRRREGAKARGRVGQLPSAPEFIPLLVGQVLADVGVRLTRGQPGKRHQASTWARVTAIVYEAAGLTPPVDIKRELIKAYPHIERRSPSPLSRSNRSKN